MSRNRMLSPCLAAMATGLVALPAFADADLLERGIYLEHAIVACGNCHTPHGPDGPLPGQEFAGGMEIPEPGLFEAHVPNITPDPTTGIGDWSDDEIVAAIREGRRPDGSIIGPPMPIELYREMSDRDVRAIVAYLRTVPPVENEVQASVFHVPLPPNYGPPVTSVPEPDRSDPVAYGAYIAGPLAHCTECHTPLIEGRRAFDTLTGAGGPPLLGPWGTSVPANLTSHPEDGLGSWTDAEIVTAITEGIGRDGRELMPPMPFSAYRNMTEDDLAALVAYLRSLPPLPDQFH